MKCSTIAVVLAAISLVRFGAIGQVANVAGTPQARPLVTAVLANDLDQVRSLLASGEKPDSRDDLGVTALVLACGRGFDRIAEALLVGGADWRKTSSYGKLPTVEAARADSLKTLGVLASRKADLNLRDKEGKTPLIAASELGLTRVAEWLLDHGAKVALRDNPGATALHVAAGGGCTDVMRLLLRRKAQHKEMDRFQRTPLFYAVKNGHADAAEVLLKVRADVEWEDIERNTPFLAAVNGLCALADTEAVKRLRILDVLREAGAKIDARNAAGHSSLMLAAMAGKLGVIRYLVDAGVNLNSTDNGRRTALTWALLKDHPDAAAALRKAGAKE